MEKIAYLAYYFQDLYLDSCGDGHSELIEQLNLIPGKLDWNKLREILSYLIRHKKYGITESALATIHWLRTIHPDLIPMDDEIEKLTRICKRYEIPIDRTIGAKEIKHRKGLQLVRYFWLMQQHIVGKHSRAPTFFFSDQELCIGSTEASAATGEEHREHVVPCAYIRDLFIGNSDKKGYFHQKRLVTLDREDVPYANQLATRVTRLLCVVYVSNDQWEKLDKGDSPLKVRMPEGWNPETDDILARLKFHGWNKIIPIPNSKHSPSVQF
ncbi:hypothetical protein G7045_09445 [Acidovorax sp. HDW3]|uniref:hypothetical protein n=1 Tax=Acidovorax sp. HDW3 TaxID=2714923 RepID=UPI00140E912F|nr:hypothetical protein [Acidovorax sp. HDW3]QIL44465.1 hypothetical protein G7045_09445 [Acidovorax sp. HDW3]